MSKLNHPYFCSQCKKIIYDISSLLFVEEGSSHGFCSEACIEGFFSEAVKYYEHKEQDKRSELELEEGSVRAVLEDSSVIDDFLSGPDELYCLKNDLGQNIYTLVKQNPEEITLIGICLMYKNRPSFILHLTATKDSRLVDYFKCGEKMDVIIEESEANENILEIDQEVMTLLESKKSSILADMLEHRSPADIPFESFHLYDLYLDQAMENPDEIFEKIDDEGDTILTYIKAMVKDKTTFYYFVICYKMGRSNSNELDTLVPLLAFPTLDGELYSLYRVGKMLEGSLKN